MQGARLLTNEAIDTRLQKSSFLLRETLKYAAGTSLGALGGMASAAFLGTTILTQGTAVAVGGATYVATRVFQWLGWYGIKEIAYQLQSRGPIDISLSEETL